MNKPDFAALRREFPTLEKWTYLDVARKTIPPRCVETAMQEYCRDIYDNAGADAWDSANIGTTRAALASLLGAKSGEIAFVKNTTEGINIASGGFELKPGDNIVLTDMEHVNNIWTWRHWETKGVEIRMARNDGGRLTLDTFRRAIDARTRIVSTAWVTYGNGYRVDVPGLGALCRERDIRLVVDGVQGTAILNQRLDELGADIIAIGGHKGLLGLTGTGIVWVREDLIPQLKTPFVKPVSAVGARENRQFDYVHDAHRLEGGNLSFLGLRVLRETAEFLRGIGIANIETRVRELTTHFMGAARRAGLKVLTPEPWEERAQIVSLAVDDALAVQKALFAEHVVVNVKDGALRVSMSFFNNEEDLERGLAAILRATISKAAA
jgi:selenocysteine lyase/cysteine desulfurase